MLNHDEAAIVNNALSGAFQSLHSLVDEAALGLLHSMSTDTWYRHGSTHHAADYTVGGEVTAVLEALEPPPPGLHDSYN